MSPRELPSTTLWSTITLRIPTYSVSVKTDPQFIPTYSVSVKKDPQFIPTYSVSLKKYPQFMRNLFPELQTWPNTQTSWRQHHRSLNRQDWDSFPAGIYSYRNSTVISDFCEQLWLCHPFLWRRQTVVVQATLQAARNRGRPKQPRGALASGQSVLAPWAHEGGQDFFTQL